MGNGIWLNTDVCILYRLFIAWLAKCNNKQAAQSRKRQLPGYFKALQFSWSSTARATKLRQRRSYDWCSEGVWPRRGPLRQTLLLRAAVAKGSATVEWSLTHTIQWLILGILLARSTIKKNRWPIQRLRMISLNKSYKNIHSHQSMTASPTWLAKGG